MARKGRPKRGGPKPRAFRPVSGGSIAITHRPGTYPIGYRPRKPKKHQVVRGAGSKLVVGRGRKVPPPVGAGDWVQGNGVGNLHGNGGKLGDAGAGRSAGVNIPGAIIRAEMG